jgi:valyl-tRNA synthetase
MSADLESRTRYDAAEAEARIRARWLESGLLHPENAGDASENYSIAIPLPNVTGALHMGHALNGTVQDTLIRLARMRGKRTKWIFGTDHAGIATQTQVERQLVREGTSREALGREKFVERVWQWREQYGSTIVEQFKRLGASADYEDERFTLDPPYAKAVQKVFVDLYEKGVIYRDNYMVNWDPGSHSAISDLEVEEREVTDTLYYVDYPLESGHGSVTVATVRPETMLADTAIAVHPDDDRYTRLIGETAILPLVGRRLKIIADDYVKPEFGTGALKITPGHDPNDFEIGRAHGLEEVSVIGEDGRMTAAAGERFAGLSVLEAREVVVDALRAEGRIARTEQYVHSVPYSTRSHERIEPLISLQWFMAMDELARPAIDVVRDGRITIHPEGQERRYFEWMEKIRPWCISRQLWWGHQIPVWYRGDERHVGTEPPQGDGWERDPDVLDTWFSSALWPFVTLGWPEDTPALRAFYPTDVLSTGRDILFLWVARMVMMGLEFVGEIPFDRVYVHSIIQAPDGRRMSKSLGTGIDPLDLIGGGPRPPVFGGDDSHPPGDFPAYGADAVRYGMLAMSSSQDVRFNEEKIAQGRQLANKLWNAARLVLLRVPEDVTVPDAAPKAATVEDAWILSRLQAAKAEVARAIDAFEFHHAALGLYDFVYGDLCDWYLEMIKPRLYGHVTSAGGSSLREPEDETSFRSSLREPEDETSFRSSLREPEDETSFPAIALHVLAETLALAHPVIPFVTEEIWSHVPGAEGLLLVHPYPEADPTLVDEAAEADVSRAIAATQELRGWRDRVGAAAGKVVPARLDAPGYDRTATHVARLARVEWSADGGEPVATVGVPGGSVAVLASEAVDLDAAAERAAAQRATLEKEIARAEGKLANQGFVAKAPAAVVEAEKEKLERLRRELEGL